MTENIEINIGPRALLAYTRLNYTMPYALAEFIDNATQSRLNHGSLVDVALKEEGVPLTVDVVYRRLQKEIEVKDNSIGMSRETLIEALRVAEPTIHSKGRSQYGMGLKTAACWIGGVWQVKTCELTTAVEWTATVNVQKIAEGGAIELTSRTLNGTGEDSPYHGTRVIVSEMRRHLQRKTEANLKLLLGSMYRHDIRDKTLLLTYNGEIIHAPDDLEMDTDADGKEFKQEFSTTINNKLVSGWFGVLKKGGRKYGGFSIFQNKRQIVGFPNAWRPRAIYGGEAGEDGAGNLTVQRLVGMIDLDGFDVSHTKDAILFAEDEEEQLETYLAEKTKDYKNYAMARRGARSNSNPWSRDKVKSLVRDMRPEFASGEFKDAFASTLPPLDMIREANRAQVERLVPEEEIDRFSLPGLKIVVHEQERSPNDPYVTIEADADPAARTVHVILNGLHPYYGSIESQDALAECLRQYIYDAVAERQVANQFGTVTYDSVRRAKDVLLRAKFVSDNVEHRRGESE